MALIFLLLVVCQLGAAAAQNYEKHVSQGKGQTGHPSVDWLSKLTFPLPAFTYNATGVNETQTLWYRRYYFANELGAWIEWLNYPLYKNLSWSDPSTFVCSTSYEVGPANYTNHTRGPCPNGSFVSTPQWVVDDLAYVAPYELCDPVTDPSCSAYKNTTLAAINATGDFLGELKRQKKAADINNTISGFEDIGNVLGVGYPVADQCRAHINTTLGGMDQFAQAGTQAATTIAALIPALLTVGNLFVPRSSEVFVTSFLVGIMSAMFTLGLPVTSISAIKDAHRFDVASWTFKARRSISKFGEIEDRSKSSDGTKNKPKNEVTLKELQKWSEEHDEAKNGDMLSEEQASTALTFSDLRKKVLQYEGRANLTGIPAVVIACLQLVIFIVAIGPLYFSYGTPMLLFDCNGYWTSMWLFIAAGVSALFRIIMWERGSHERVKLYAMSPTALESFKWFVGRNPHFFKTSSAAYVEDSMPPLYPPLIAKVESAVWRFCHNIMHSSDPKPMQSRRISAMQPSLATRQKNNSLRRWEVFLHNLRNPKQYFMHTWSKSQTPAGARRWRPVYLLMHLSTVGRDPKWTLFTGLVEGFILILLTVFFAAQWGGNLFVMCYTTAILLVFISAGRALGLGYVQASVKTHGLHIIETQSKDQLRGCLRVLCTLTDVLVTINGAWFFEGHRLDNRPDWAHFQRCYSLGHMDEPGHLCPNCGLNANLVLPVTNVSKAPTTTTLPMPGPLTPTSMSSQHLGRSRTRNSTSAGTSISSTSPRTSMQHGPPQQQASAPPARPSSIRRSTEPVRSPLSSNP